MINFNGNFFENSKAILTVDNRGFKFGDGLFETIKIENSKVRFLEDHYFRLMASMRLLRMEIPSNFNLDFFESEVCNCAFQNKLENARVRMTVFRKGGGLYQPVSNEVHYVIEAVPLNVVLISNYKVVLFHNHYIHSGLLSTLKSTNRLINVLASVFAAENNFDNCILLNEHKRVVEVINGNLFIVNGTRIKTPAISEGCINGIIRKKMIHIISNHSYYSIEETEITPIEIQKADELFITNTMVGIQSITSYKKSAFKGVVAKKLALELDKLV